MRSKADVTDRSEFMASRASVAKESYNDVAFVSIGLRHHLRILLPPGSSAVEVGMLPQRPTLSGLGSAHPIHARSQCSNQTAYLTAGDFRRSSSRS
jgi:hypothetical protein